MLIRISSRMPRRLKYSFATLMGPVREIYELNRKRHDRKVPTASPPIKLKSTSKPPACHAVKLMHLAIGFVKYYIARQVGIALGMNVQPSRRDDKEYDKVHLLREVEQHLRRNDTAPTRLAGMRLGIPASFSISAGVATASGHRCARPRLP